MQSSRFKKRSLKNPNSTRKLARRILHKNANSTCKLVRCVLVENTKKTSPASGKYSWYMLYVRVNLYQFVTGTLQRPIHHQWLYHHLHLTMMNNHHRLHYQSWIRIRIRIWIRIRNR